ncbi:hypothetical protein HOL21_00320 [Candidatus Woesearchaeota archaeon]|jgi:hypothetical protein|nr:hypothetical protein [Candidatus Woesearchaeota archaeon]MBT5396642.1 hypothetical protein [Candidatus Woesearchaeota archaeon]MBT5924661.1 hypothetical protein [Candidatus Woesearchaeota archaeon]MBT6367571.1 hypothetical protein [Candidatus Woesearchaeota archaeon]MBT7763070.1 hypothetical protein [Candidatus Woesearchaeota archaeon]
MKLRFSPRFYGGIGLLFFSFLIGKGSQLVFFLYLDDIVIRWIAIATYVLSWIPFFLGIWWIGQEYAEAVRKYFSYKFYTSSLRKGTRKVVTKTKQVGGRVKNKVKEKRLQHKVNRANKKSAKRR